MDPTASRYAQHWSEPKELPYPIDMGGGWIDMPAIDPSGEGLWFVYWNGEFELDPAVACSDIGRKGIGNHGDNFDIYFARRTPSGGWQQPVAFEPAPSERFSSSLDRDCFEQSVLCGCNAWAPGKRDPGCRDQALPCSHYEGCKVVGSEGAAVRSFDGKALYFSREELELNGDGFLAPTTRIWVTHQRDSVVGWDDPIRLPATVNARGVRVDTPTISPDNKRLCVSRATNAAFDGPRGESSFEIWCADRADPTDDQGWGALWRSTLNRMLSLDYQPMFTAGGDLLFTTSRGGLFRLTVNLAVPSGSDYYDTGIFPALRWFDGPSGHREGAGSLSADGRTFYFLRSTGSPGGDLCTKKLRVFRSEALAEPDDCRSQPCGPGERCLRCWGTYQCMADGSYC